MKKVKAAVGRDDEAAEQLVLDDADDGDDPAKRERGPSAQRPPDPTEEELARMTPAERKRAMDNVRKRRQRDKDREIGRTVRLDLDSDTYGTIAEQAEKWGVTMRLATQHLLDAGMNNADLEPPHNVPAEERRRGDGGFARHAEEFTPRFISFFAGIEAFSLAAEPLGWQRAGVAQWAPDDPDQYAAEVLLRRLGTSLENLGDIRYVRPEHLRGFDVLVGGSPCQAFSIAGQQKGFDDPRGRLTARFIDLATNARVRRSPKGVPGTPIIVWENVENVLAHRYDNAKMPEDKTRLDPHYRDECDVFGSVLTMLAGWSRGRPTIARPRSRSGAVESWWTAGVVHGPQREVAWRILDSSLFGLPQGRNRLFVVATRYGDEMDAARILFEDPQIPLANKPQWENDDYVVWGVRRFPRGPRVPAPVGDSLSALIVRDAAEEEAYLITPEHADRLLQHAARFDRRTSKDGTSHVPKWVRAVLDAVVERGPWLAMDDIARRLYGEAGAFEEMEAALRSGTAFIDAYQQNGRITVRDTVACTMMAKYGEGPEWRPFIVQRDGDRVWVRGIMPVEGERLMGFPDRWTDIPGWTPMPVADGEPASQEGLRFKTLGNSMAVPVVSWLAKRIDTALRTAIASGNYLEDRAAPVENAFLFGKRPQLWTRSADAKFARTRATRINEMEALESEYLQTMQAHVKKKKTKLFRRKAVAVLQGHPEHANLLERAAEILAEKPRKTRRGKRASAANG